MFNFLAEYQKHSKNLSDSRRNPPSEFRTPPLKRPKLRGGAAVKSSSGNLVGPEDPLAKTLPVETHSTGDIFTAGQHLAIKAASKLKVEKKDVIRDDFDVTENLLFDVPLHYGKTGSHKKIYFEPLQNNLMEQLHLKINTPWRVKQSFIHFRFIVRPNIYCQNRVLCWRPRRLLNFFTRMKIIGGSNSREISPEITDYPEFLKIRSHCGLDLRFSHLNWKEASETLIRNGFLIASGEHKGEMPTEPYFCNRIYAPQDPREDPVYLWMKDNLIFCNADGSFVVEQDVDFSVLHGLFENNMGPTTNLNLEFYNGNLGDCFVDLGKRPISDVTTINTYPAFKWEALKNTGALNVWINGVLGAQSAVLNTTLIMAPEVPSQLQNITMEFDKDNSLAYIREWYPTSDMTAALTTQKIVSNVAYTNFRMVKKVIPLQPGTLTVHQNLFRDRIPQIIAIGVRKLPNLAANGSMPDELGMPPAPHLVGGAVRTAYSSGPRDFSICDIEWIKITFTCVNPQEYLLEEEQWKNVGQTNWRRKVAVQGKKVIMNWNQIIYGVVAPDTTTPGKPDYIYYNCAEEAPIDNSSNSEFNLLKVYKQANYQSQRNPEEFRLSESEMERHFASFSDGLIVLETTAKGGELGRFEYQPQFQSNFEIDIRLKGDTYSRKSFISAGIKTTEVGGVAPVAGKPNAKLETALLEEANFHKLELLCYRWYYDVLLQDGQDQVEKLETSGVAPLP